MIRHTERTEFNRVGGGWGSGCVCVCVWGGVSR